MFVRICVKQQALNVDRLPFDSNSSIKAASRMQRDTQAIQEFSKSTSSGCVIAIPPQNIALQG